jgi:O-antigen chain-terminating methyltransferase
MRQIRGDVAARWPGGEEPSVNAEIVAPAPSVPLARLGAFAEDLPKKSRYSAADFLAYHDEDFLRQVYRRILGRDPDREGASRYLERIRSGALSRIELLGRIRYSAEGRAAGTRVDGLLLPFALRTARRAPIAGRLLGIVQYLWRLPDLVRNHELLESAVFANRTEFRTKVNGILDDIGQRLHGLDAQVAKLDFMDAEVTRIARRVDEVERAKANHGDVDRNVSELRALAARVDEVDRAKANHGDVDRNVGELRALASQEELARRALATRVDDAFSRIDEAESPSSTRR